MVEIHSFNRCSLRFFLNAVSCTQGTLTSTTHFSIFSLKGTSLLTTLPALYTTTGDIFIECSTAHGSPLLQTPVTVTLPPTARTQSQRHTLLCVSLEQHPVLVEISPERSAIRFKVPNPGYVQSCLQAHSVFARSLPSSDKRSFGTSLHLFHKDPASSVEVTQYILIESKPYTYYYAFLCYTLSSKKIC